MTEEYSTGKRSVIRLWTALLKAFLHHYCSERKTMGKHKIIKIFWIILGFIGFGIGTVGVVVPLLPSFPFYMLTLFAFAKSFG